MNIEEMHKRADNNLCPFCGKDMTNATFRDELSLKEYQISGLCQACQDEFFGE